MASYNRVILMGNVTRDVEVRYTPNGTAVCTVGIATSKPFKQGDQWKEKTTFLDVTCWARNAEVAGEYLRKGSPVFIEGTIELEKWDDKKTGEPRSKVQIVCESLKLLGSKGEGKSKEQPQSQAASSDYGDPKFDGDNDDVPF